MIFRQDDVNLKHFYDDHVNTDISYLQFKDLFSKCWNDDDHGFLVTDTDRRGLDCVRYRKGFDCFAMNILRTKWNWQCVMKDRSDDIAEEFRWERKTLSQIEKASCNAVRRKYRLLKEGKQATEKALGETVHPIVNLLKRLVTATDTNAREIKNLMPKKTVVQEENQCLEASSFKRAYDDTEEEDNASTELPRGDSSVEKYHHLLKRNESNKVSPYDERTNDIIWLTTPDFSRSRGSIQRYQTSSYRNEDKRRHCS